MFEQEMRWFCNYHNIPEIDIYHMPTLAEAEEISWRHTGTDYFGSVVMNYRETTRGVMIHKAGMVNIPFICLSTTNPSTLFHELIHWLQEAQGRLKIVERDGWPMKKWNGQLYSPDTPHKDCPWEIEAYATQEYWANKFYTENVYAYRNAERAVA